MFLFPFNTYVSLCVGTLFSLHSFPILFLPLFHLADVLTASTASYGLEGKCTALMHLSKYQCFPQI